MTLSTPVAFFIFNRPDTTSRVFEAIRRVRPQRLLVIADGPRENRSGEAEKCSAARAVINQVDWPCDLLKNYSESNLGCKRRVSSGLDWVFATVEEAIILEDDCLPHPTFFNFCDELLNRYRNDERIMLVSGYNLIPDVCRDKASYFFSKYPQVWGWASWRRSWRHYDVNMKLWPKIRDSERFHDICGGLRERTFWKDWFNVVHGGKVDTWDAQLTFALFCQSGLVAKPKVNMVRNIGFGVDATHTKSIDQKHRRVEPCALDFPLEHPEIIVRDIHYDSILRKREYSHSTLRLLKKAVLG